VTAAENCRQVPRSDSRAAGRPGSARRRGARPARPTAGRPGRSSTGWRLRARPPRRLRQPHGRRLQCHPHGQKAVYGRAEPVEPAVRQRRAAKGVRLARAAGGVGAAYAAVSVYWALGGTWLFDTVAGTLERHGPLVPRASCWRYGRPPY